MIMYWKIFTDSKSSRSSEIVFKRTISALGVDYVDLDIEEYHKGGFTCSFSTLCELNNWPEVVTTSLALAQKIGRQWIVSGNIASELDIWSSEASISGVQNIQLIVDSSGI